MTASCKSEQGRRFRAENATRYKNMRRRYRQRHRETTQARYRLSARMQGRRPRTDTRGSRHPSWAGGKYVACEICGAILGYRSPYRQGRERARCDRHKYWGEQQCIVCGAWISTRNNSGICSRNPACKREYHRQYYHQHKAPLLANTPCELCGTLTWATNRTGVCNTNRQCKLEYHRRRYRLQKEHSSETKRQAR
jgi:hypothetical protein